MSNNKRQKWVEFTIVANEKNIGYEVKIVIIIVIMIIII